MKKGKQQKLNCQIRKASEHLKRRKITNTENIGSRHHQTDERKNKKWVPHKKKKTSWETKLCSRNHFKRINSWVVPLVRYSGPWRKEELRQMGQKRRKLMTTDKALHPRDNRQIICVKKRRRKKINFYWGLHRYFNTKS